MAADKSYANRLGPRGPITNGPPDISWYQIGLLGENVCPNNPQFNGMTRQMTRLEALLLMWPPKPKHLKWDYRVNFGILGIIFTASWYLYQQTVADPDECPNEFFQSLRLK